MLIFPAQHQLNWSKPPLATLALILINSLIFIIWQTQDNEKIVKAVEFYISKKSLAKHELNAFRLYLKRAHPKKFEELKRIPNQYKNQWMLGQLVSDRDFERSLKKSYIIKPKDKIYEQWKKDRAQFEQLMNDVSTKQLGFIPSERKPITWFTTMFLHGSWDHLFGNMVFLLIFGLGLEALLGAKVFLLLYLAGGFCATGLYALINADSVTPLVGASGAISGLMGAYVTTYGTRKIQFFYWLIFYFNYIRLPALVLLPVWIGKEYYDWQSNTNSNVAYMAHIGGLIGGALLVAVSRHAQPFEAVKIENSAAGVPLDENQERQLKLDQAYESALNQVAALNFDGARKTLRDLVNEEPKKTEYLASLFHIEKLKPGGASYQWLIDKIVQLPLGNPENDKLLASAYRSLLDAPSIENDSLNKWHTIGLKAAIGQKQFDFATEVLSQEIEKDNAPSWVPPMLLALALALKKRGDVGLCNRQLKKLVEKFEHSEEAELAKGLLKKGGGRDSLKSFELR